MNKNKIGKTYKVLFDRKEGDYFIGRTECDSPDVDNEVLVKAALSASDLSFNLTPELVLLKLTTSPSLLSLSKISGDIRLMSKNKLSAKK